jgi:1,2-phenylacetyl-CoA epoxidase PaaB subunit
MPRWSVDIIRARAEHLGEVDAPDERAAIKRAAEVFDKKTTWAHLTVGTSVTSAAL